jgi:hypothetical protein
VNTRLSSLEILRNAGATVLTGDARLEIVATQERVPCIPYTRWVVTALIACKRLLGSAQPNANSATTYPPCEADSALSSFRVDIHSHSLRVSTIRSPKIVPQSPHTRSPFEYSSMIFGGSDRQLGQR